MKAYSRSSAACGGPIYTNAAGAIAVYAWLGEALDCRKRLSNTVYVHLKDLSSMCADAKYENSGYRYTATSLNCSLQQGKEDIYVPNALIYKKEKMHHSPLLKNGCGSSQHKLAQLSILQGTLDYLAHVLVTTVVSSHQLELSQYGRPKIQALRSELKRLR
ncbi:hypothetical protein EVAR_73145_1 [Eumeta japonica]|uniref:Uncharacterized protein n=1 Tax=Eumeta variegata TaxID=151549 RepID=A0A4C1SNN4_EUMVA|nr:hypothetical protein EVAR_73145_1 [Eumeta japonica]